MPTMMDTINAAKALKSGAKLSRCKPVNNMNISASVDVKKSKEFHLVSVRLKRLPMLFAAGAPEDGPLIIDKNFGKIGKLNCDYIPKVVVLGGRKLLREAKAAGTLTSIAAWVGDKAIGPLHIMASDSISNSDLESKLNALIRSTYQVKKQTSGNNDAYYDSYPYLKDVFQGDSYCIFSMAKAMFMQKYKVDATTRNVTLDGTKVEVFTTYSPAPTGDVSSAMDEVCETSGPSYPGNAKTTGLPQGAFAGPNFNVQTIDVTNFGAPGSEANNPQLKMMLNIEDALDQYLSVIKNGSHQPVSMAGLRTPAMYVNASREVTIALKARGATPANFSTMDFLRWQDKKMTLKAAAQTKLVNGEALIADSFAYVGDPRDVSTWHLPIASASHVRSSIKLMASCSAIPKFEREEVRARLKTAATDFAIKVK